MLKRVFNLKNLRSIGFSFLFAFGTADPILPSGLLPAQPLLGFSRNAEKTLKQVLKTFLMLSLFIYYRSPEGRADAERRGVLNALNVTFRRLKFKKTERELKALIVYAEAIKRMIFEEFRLGGTVIFQLYDIIVAVSKSMLAYLYSEWPESRGKRLEKTEFKKSFEVTLPEEAEIGGVTGVVKMPARGSAGMEEVDVPELSVGRLGDFFCREAYEGVIGAHLRTDSFSEEIVDFLKRGGGSSEAKAIIFIRGLAAIMGGICGKGKSRLTKMAYKTAMRMMSLITMHPRVCEIYDVDSVEPGVQLSASYVAKFSAIGVALDTLSEYWAQEDSRLQRMLLKDDEETKKGYLAFYFLRSSIPVFFEEGNSTRIFFPKTVVFHARPPASPIYINVDADGVRDEAEISGAQVICGRNEVYKVRLFGKDRKRSTEVASPLAIFSGNYGGEKREKFERAFSSLFGLGKSETSYETRVAYSGTFGAKKEGSLQQEFFDILADSDLRVAKASPLRGFIKATRLAKPGLFSAGAKKAYKKLLKSLRGKASKSLFGGITKSAKERNRRAREKLGRLAALWRKMEPFERLVSLAMIDSYFRAVLIARKFLSAGQMTVDEEALGRAASVKMELERQKVDERLTERRMKWRVFSERTAALYIISPRAARRYVLATAFLKFLKYITYIPRKLSQAIWNTMVRPALNTLASAFTVPVFFTRPGKILSLTRKAQREMRKADKAFLAVFGDEFSKLQLSDNDVRYLDAFWRTTTYLWMVAIWRLVGAGAPPEAYSMRVISEIGPAALIRGERG